MRVLVDMDEVLNDLVPTILAKYNEKYNDNIEISDITNYHLHKFLKPECTNIFKEFVDDDLILSLNVKPYAIEVLEQLNKDNQIYFVTAGHPATAKARDKWLQKTFPFYRGNQLVLCRDKHIIKADLMIDDCPNNIIAAQCSHKFLLDMPWNRATNLHKYGIKLPIHTVRCYDWQHILHEYHLLKGE